MSVLSEVKKIESKQILSGILAFLALIGPGFLIIYHYHPGLIEKLDTIKILAFSTALTLPVFMLNTMIASGSHPSKNGPLGEAFALSAIGTTGVLYGALVAAYVYHLNFLSMCIWVVCFEVFHWLLCYLAQRSERKEKVK